MKGYHHYKTCIDACLRCAAICNHCAASCLQDADVKMMATCIRLSMECAAACYAAAQLISLGSDKSRDIFFICADTCEACALECEKYDNEHCRECAKACRTCVDECGKM